MRETAHSFGDGASLVGIVTRAETTQTISGVVSSRRPAVVLLNSGLIHRVAPNRLYVHLARTLAKAGHDCLRFDFSGIGDSSVRTDALPVEESGVRETQDAMGLMATLRDHRKCILMGLCGGGYFSFRTACADQRVAGAVLINTRGHLHGLDPHLDDQLRQRTLARHLRRIAWSKSYRRKNVIKLLTGSFDFRGAVKSLARRGRLRRQEAVNDGQLGQDLDLLRDRGVRLLNIYSEGDEGLDYLTAALGPNYRDKLSAGSSTFEPVQGTNHVFTLLWSQQHLLDTIMDWIGSVEWT